MSTVKRRNFIKAAGLGILPALIPGSSLAAGVPVNEKKADTPKVIRFFGDGQSFDQPNI